MVRSSCGSGACSSPVRPAAVISTDRAEAAIAAQPSRTSSHSAMDGHDRYGWWHPHEASRSPIYAGIVSQMSISDPRIEGLLDGLNPAQREAVTHVDGPLLILAGAGSGKTRVLTHRIAYLIATDHAKPDEIIAITFTNKAAGEMRDRAGLLVGRRVRAMWVMTFHSASARILRAHADKLGFTRQFTIYDQADSRRLVKRCLDDLGIDPKRYTPASIQHQISAAKNMLTAPDEYAQAVGSVYEQVVADVYASHETQAP